MKRIKWTTADESDQRLLQIISDLIGPNHHDLVELIFDPKFPLLKVPSSVLLAEIGYLSHGEIQLVRLAVDIWSGEGGWSLPESLTCWTENQWHRFFQAICRLLEITITGD